jgi:hypothetical protein
LEFLACASRVFARQLQIRSLRKAERVPRLPSSTNQLPTAGGGIKFSDTVLSWIIFPAILLVYLLFPTKNYYWDGIFFSRVVEDASGFHPTLVHPNHLLYNVFGYVFYRLIKAVGLNWRAVEVLTVANCIVSVLTAFLLFRILGRSLESRYLTWASTLLFAFSATWWKFSTDANAYILSVFCLLIAFYFLLPPYEPRPLLVAVIFSVAVCFHQLAVIVYPVMALGVLWQAESVSKTRRNLVALQFCVFAFGLVFTAYYFCFYLASGTTSPGRFAQWVTSYSPDASFSFDFLSNLGYTLRGHWRLFFNGRLSLLKGLVTPPIAVLIGVLVALILVWFFLLVRGLKNLQMRKLREFRLGKLAKLAALWVVVYLAFLFFWLPQNTFYRLFHLPAIIILLGEILDSRRSDLSARSGRKYRLAVFVAIMALFNFLFFIFPYSHAEKFPPLAMALEMNKVWQPGTVVYYGSENSDNNLFHYFNRDTSWKPLPEQGQLEVELQSTYDAGHEVWFEASAIDHLQKSQEGREWFSRHAREDARHERRDRGHNIKFIKIVP